MQYRKSPNIFEESSNDGYVSFTSHPSLHSLGLLIKLFIPTVRKKGKRRRTTKRGKERMARRGEEE